MLHTTKTRKAYSSNVQSMPPLPTNAFRISNAIDIAIGRLTRLQNPFFSIRNHGMIHRQANAPLGGVSDHKCAHVTPEAMPKSRYFLDLSLTSTRKNPDHISRLFILTFSISVRFARVLGFALSVTFLVTRLSGSCVFLWSFRRCSKAGDAAGLEGIHLTC